MKGHVVLQNKSPWSWLYLHFAVKEGKNKEPFLLLLDKGSSSFDKLAAFFLVFETAHTVFTTLRLRSIWDHIWDRSSTEAKRKLSTPTQVSTECWGLNSPPLPWPPSSLPPIICLGVDALKTSPPFFMASLKPSISLCSSQSHDNFTHCFIICQSYDYDFLLLMEALIKKPSLLCLYSQWPQLRTYSFGRRIYSFVISVKKLYRGSCILKECNFSSYQIANI